MLRPALNAVAALRGRPRLPAVGSPLSLAFLSHGAADGDDPEHVIALVQAACRESAESGIDHLVLGFAAGNPLAAAIERSFPVRSYDTIIYIVHRPRARGAVELLDGRPPHLEVATL